MHMVPETMRGSVKLPHFLFFNWQKVTNHTTLKFRSKVGWVFVCERSLTRVTYSPYGFWCYRKVGSDYLALTQILPFNQNLF